jgi:hypothetical protein
MFKLVMLILFILFFSFLSGEETAARIRESRQYYHGEVSEEEGYYNYEEARERALSRLSENISINITSNFEDFASEVNGVINESVRSIVKTYSNITLKNIKPLQSMGTSGWNVMYYIHQDSLNVIYNERKRLVVSLYEEARQNEINLNLGYALQLYYYSLVLMNSIPHAVIDYRNENLRVSVNSRITTILSGIRFYYDGENQPQDDIRDLKLRVEYDNQPVERLEFSYLLKDTMIKNTVSGGLAYCRLTGACTSYSNLDIDVQYRFSQNKEQFKDVAALWQAVIKPNYYASQKKIDLIKYQPLPRYQTETASINVFYDDDSPVKADISKGVHKFIQALQQKKLPAQFKSDAFLHQKLQDLIKYNNPEIIENEYNVNINKTYEGWEVRAIPVFCFYPSLERQATDNLVLDFDDAGTLKDVNFSLFSGLYDSYVSDYSIDDTFQKRQVLIKFLEKYRSAYLNRDEKTLERIFSDDAVIIVGREMPRGTAIRDIEMRLDDGQPDVEYLKMNKTEFMNRQKRIFADQSDIHLGFNTCKVRQNNEDEDLFGISMRQEYASTGYSDEGYLFLLVDFKASEPMIYIRSWQPSEWDDAVLIDMTNFLVRK